MIVRQVLNWIPIHSLKSSETMSETYCERWIVKDLVEMVQYSHSLAIPIPTPNGELLMTCLKHSRISSSLLEHTLLEESLYDGCVYGRAFSSGMKLLEVVSNRVS